MTNAEQEQAVRDAALAGWESTTMQNLGPLLTTPEAEALWACVLALRSSKDVAAFAAAARKAVPVRLFEVGAKLNAALDRLAVLFPSPVAASAQET